MKEGTLRKRYETISTASRFTYRVVLQRVWGQKLSWREPHPVSFDVMVTSQYAGEDVTPFRSVNYGPWGYRGGIFRYRPDMFIGPDPMGQAEVAAELRFRAIVEMLTEAARSYRA
jgi:hypothetical protein